MWRSADTITYPSRLSEYSHQQERREQNRACIFEAIEAIHVGWESGANLGHTPDAEA